MSIGTIATTIAMWCGPNIFGPYVAQPLMNKFFGPPNYHKISMPIQVGTGIALGIIPAAIAVKKCKDSIQELSKTFKSGQELIEEADKATGNIAGIPVKVKESVLQVIDDVSKRTETLFQKGPTSSEDSSLNQSLFGNTITREGENICNNIARINTELTKLINQNLSLINRKFILGILTTSTAMLIPGTLSAIGITIAQKYIKKYLYTPNLIKKQLNHTSYVTRIKNYLFNYKKPNFENLMIISDQLKKQLHQVVKMTENVKKNGGFYENILLYGLPGTGKTLFAQSLAETCDMDYILISASDISPYLNPAPGETTAVEEINKLFKKASKSKRGTIIFFDEAEAFLADRTTLNQAAYNALTTFLTQTGTPSNNVMVICATNIPKKIDTAVLSRFGMHIEFPLPDEKAIESILSMHIKNVFGNQNTGKKIAYTLLTDSEQIKALAIKLVGQSGRTIQKFANQLRQYALAMDENEITETTITTCLENIHAKIA